MIDCSYVNQIIEKYNKNGALTQNENTAITNLSQMINNWFSSFREPYSVYPRLEIQQSGSRAKGTAIKGKSDIDLFFSITDPDNANTLESYYCSVFEYLKSQRLTVRKQNVSIGVKYYNCDIDVVPAKKVNSQSYQRFYDHYLWSNKHNKRMLTNIQKHIDMVRFSGVRKEIMLLKIWRENHNLDFPSIYIEILSVEELEKNNKQNLEENFLHMLKYIADNIESKRVVDPGNCNNIISDSLSSSEKTAIAKQARSSLAKTTWNDIIW